MNRLLKSIYDSQLPFLDRLPIERTYQCIIDEAISLSGMNDGSLFLMKKGGLKRTYTTSSQFYEIKIRKDGLTYQGFKSKMPYIIQTDSAKRIHPLLKKIGIKTIVIVPLMYKDKPLGIISLYGRRKRKLSQKQLTRLQLFVGFATLHFKRHSFIHKLNKQSPYATCLWQQLHIN
jgi:transcriptional regulator with GAF, ATPase, and Fis domain